MTSLMDQFLSSGATAYPSTAAAKKMLKEIPALASVEVVSLKTSLRSQLSAKTSLTKAKTGGRG